MPVILRNLKQMIFQKQVLMSCIIPIQDKPHCKRCDRCTFNTQMCISPITKLFVFSNIFPAYIETTNKANLSINHDNFSVISIIHTHLKLSQNRREEFCDPNSFAFQPVPISFVHGTTSHTVKQNSDFYTFMCFLDQYLLYILPHFIIPDNIILYMDIFLRTFHFLDQCMKLLFTICINTDIIIICQNCLSGLQIIKHKIPEPVKCRTRHLQLPVINGFLLPSHSVFQLTFNLLCLKHLILVIILPYDQIQDKSDNRNKIKQKQPGPYCLR